jgi:hypothetical protein
VIDYSGVLLPGVGGSTTSTIRTRGQAALAGIVVGPDGPVPQATVRVERLVGDQVRRTDVVAGADGRYSVRGIPGGRYRVRAFLPPTFAQVDPELFFLADRDERRVDLDVERFEGLTATAAVAPNPPVVDQPVNLVVQLAARSVDGDGVARVVPQGGRRIELLEPTRWSLVSDAVQITDGGGRAVYELRCEVAGAPRLLVRVMGTTDATTLQPLAPIALAVPDCIASNGVGTTTTSGGSSTSTTTD